MQIKRETTATTKKQVGKTVFSQVTCGKKMGSSIAGGEALKPSNHWYQHERNSKSCKTHKISLDFRGCMGLVVSSLALHPSSHNFVLNLTCAGNCSSGIRGTMGTGLLPQS